ncbi:MAG: adenylyl-sulfate kinase [Myxococcota bacterium]
MWHVGEVDASMRRKNLGHGGCVVWLTGLSGSGKSTIAHRLERILIGRQVFAYVLDGDNVRHGLCRDLDFSAAGRNENIRRIGEVAKLFADAGAVVMTAFISPYRADRHAVREAVLAPFVEVFVDTPLEVCEARDPKGLYARARAGEISQFTGISAPYEPPEQAEVHLEMHDEQVDAAAMQVIGYLETRGILIP